MDFSSPWQKRVSAGRGEIPTVSPVEKLTNRTEPEAHHERTSTAPRPYHEHTSSPRPYHERTSTAPEPYLDHITTYLDHTTSVPRQHHKPYLDRTASVRVDHTSFFFFLFYMVFIHVIVHVHCGLSLPVKHRYSLLSMLC